jgi:uncharacterized protein (DUF885 family)
MKIIKLVILLVVILELACNQSPQSENQQKSESIDSLFNAFSEERWQLMPILATKAGDKRYNHILPNHLSENYRTKLKEHYTKYKKLSKGIDKSTLSEVQQMNCDVMMWECDIYLESFEFEPALVLNYDGMNFSFSYHPINQFWSTNLFIGQLAGGRSMQPFRTVKDYENWLLRINDFMVWCDTAIGNMRKGITKGIVLPKALIKKVIPQMENFAKGPAKEHIYYRPILNIPADFSEEDSTRLEAEYVKMIEEKVIPKHQELYDFFVNEYLPNGIDEAGIGAQPNGERLYNFLIKYFTTTNMTADEIFELGEKEVARITAEMEKVKQQVGFEGDIDAFYDHVKNNKKLKPFTEPQQVIDNFNAIYARMKPNLEKLFDKTPKTPFEVRRVEAFREKTASAHYNPGAKDGSRPGVFYVPIPEVKKYNVFSDEDLFLHEAIPGHHYQIALQQENTDLPGFMQMLWQSAFGEGWALYTEFLGKELGLFEDPYQYFGMLSAEKHRAVRLVVDVGIHAKGWTREEAIQYCLENEALPESKVISEVERYMAMPGQALSYKIGQLKIMKWRQKAEEELGEKFDIKEFHNKLLESGCVPLQLLENKINRWIEEVKKNNT